MNPFGEIVAVAARGDLMGNRGCLHDDHRRVVRHHRGKAWIACVTGWKGQRRELTVPGRYTELFFRDEATALAAGHRPCATCRRDRFLAFRVAWAEAGCRAKSRAPRRWTSACTASVWLRRAGGS